MLGQQHVDRYRETDGEEGHDWQGTTVLLLTTTGRNSGAKWTTPLIHQRHGHDYLAVASNGGGDPPGWLLNLQDDPIVAVQVKADDRRAATRVVPDSPSGGPHGRAGCAGGCSRTGECLGISIWEDAEAERASRELGRRSRETSSQAGGTVTAPDVDVYEVGFEARALEVA